VSALLGRCRRWAVGASAVSAGLGLWLGAGAGELPSAVAVMTAGPVARPCSVPRGVHATQVVVVVSSGSRATIRACRKVSGRYLTQLGPYSGHVGFGGVTSRKREGDGRTPAGTFALLGGFGATANPGLRAASWLRVDPRDVWVDDPRSRFYDLHERTPVRGRWASAEKMLQRPAYDDAQVIGWNLARTPGRGSAIFLHVDLGRSTAGCVSLPASALRSVLRWERSGAVISIR
jgi:L,D-peptidoglycan transpeptidase YkuD (ErfK/YbiS/YcfS/YnhG family)